MKRLTRTSLRPGLSGGGLLLGGVLVGVALSRFVSPPLTVRSGVFPEELVYVRSDDGIVNAGLLFAPPDSAARPVAVIWVHGWGVNFYSPTYVAIGRSLAERGVATVSVNTRMHDLGTVAGYRSGERIRGGGYWGVTSEVSLDLSAWIDFATGQGFERVVLVGHSAGWAAVAAYETQNHDPRVVGVVLASGAVQVQRPERDPALMAQAIRLVDAGDGDDLLRLPNRSFPAFISAATFLDIANTPPEVLDFFGVEVDVPGVASLRKPLLAFFGTRGDVGGQADLEIVRSSTEMFGNDASPAETVMIDGVDHMYTGGEAQVAEVISDWIERRVVASGQPGETRVEP